MTQDSEIEDAAINNMEGDSSDEEDDDDDLSTVDVKEYFMETWTVEKIKLLVVKFLN